MDFFPPIDEITARNINPLVLAYIGDAVHSLYVRQSLAISTTHKAGQLHVLASSQVNAHSQALLASGVFDSLTEQEQHVFKRARNSKAGHNAKNQTRVDYKKATAIEAVIGYLYLIGNTQRIKQLLGECDDN